MTTQPAIRSAELAAIWAISEHCGFKENIKPNKNHISKTNMTYCALCGLKNKLNCYFFCSMNFFEYTGYFGFVNLIYSLMLYRMRIASAVSTVFGSDPNSSI